MTGASDETVILWDYRTDKQGRLALHTLQLASSAMAMDWGASDDAALTLIGMILKSGNLQILSVLNATSLTEVSTISGKGCGTAIRFAPDLKFVAAGRRNGRLDLYGGSGNGLYEHLGGFSAHSGPCCALDWSCPHVAPSSTASRASSSGGVAGGGGEGGGKGYFFVRSNSYEPEELLFWQVVRETSEVKQVRRMKDVVACVWRSERCRVAWPSQVCRVSDYTYHTMQ